MKTLLLTVLFLISSCSFLRTENVQEKKKTEAEKAVVLKYGAVWELLSPQKIIIHLQNVDRASPLSLVLAPGMDRKAIPAGHWELVGIEANGKIYSSSSTSKKYILNMKSHTDVYAGSLVVDCPKVSTKYFHLLKKMKFFNRYTFNHDGQYCEIVIGNDFDGVRSKLINSSKSKKLNLEIGL